MSAEVKAASDAWPLILPVLLLIFRAISVPVSVPLVRQSQCSRLAGVALVVGLPGPDVVI